MKIELTETEIIHIMDSLRLRVQDLRDCDDVEAADLANELEELEHDLFEALARPGDWTEDLDPTDLEGRTFSIAEDDFIDHGMRAREMAKNHNARTFGEFEVGSSKAADRRAQRMMKGTASPVDGSSWPLNDPIDW